MNSADYRSIPVDELYFDPANPRIPRGVDATDDTQVLGWLLDDAGLVELMGSIAANGFFPAEPLLVTRRIDGPGFTVLEGNRRLAAVRLLLKPDEAPARKQAVRTVAADVVDTKSLQELPCAVFGDRSDVLDYLGFRHVTGVKQWEPEAKARYLQELYRLHSATAGEDVFKLIARLIGSRSDYVVKLLASLSLHDQIRSDEELSALLIDDAVPFSVLTLAFSYKAIPNYMEITSLEDVARRAAPDEFVNVDRLREIATWIYHERPELDRTQLGDSRNMKLLAHAVARPEGVDALRRGVVVEEAATATLDVEEMMVRALRQSIEKLLAAQRLLYRAPVTGSTLQTLVEIEELLDQLVVGARRKARRTESDRV